MAHHLLLIVRSCSTSFIHLVTRLSSMKSAGRRGPKNSKVYSSSRKLNPMTHSELKTYNLFKNEEMVINVFFQHFYFGIGTIHILGFLDMLKKNGFIEEFIRLPTMEEALRSTRAGVCCGPYNPSKWEADI